MEETQTALAAIVGSLAIIVGAVASIIKTVYGKRVTDPDPAVIDGNIGVGAALLAGFEVKIAAFRAEAEDCKRRLDDLEKQNAIITSGLYRRIGQLEIENESLRIKTGDPRSGILNGRGRLVVEIHDLMIERMEMEELRTLAFDLDLDYENFEGETKSGFVRSLVAHMNNRNAIDRLVAALQRRRPDINWPNFHH